MDSRNPFAGIEKPESLKHNYTGCWSRRIDAQHRIVYQVENDSVIILPCRHHY
ncbi:MAG: Txe/YoeB family addiction module toxin [Candidatus Omnitrophota bacterium]|nr:MAG: Txe/YoeB family addiction module toxin [Candidatus Omnitrophota bacterium]